MPIPLKPGNERTEPTQRRMSDLLHRMEMNWGKKPTDVLPKEIQPKVQNPDGSWKNPTPKFPAGSDTPNTAGMFPATSVWLPQLGPSWQVFDVEQNPHNWPVNVIERLYLLSTLTENQPDHARSLLHQEFRRRITGEYTVTSKRLQYYPGILTQDIERAHQMTRPVESEDDDFLCSDQDFDHQASRITAVSDSNDGEIMAEQEEQMGENAYTPPHHSAESSLQPRLSLDALHRLYNTRKHRKHRRRSPPMTPDLIEKSLSHSSGRHPHRRSTKRKPYNLLSVWSQSRKNGLMKSLLRALAGKSLTEILPQAMWPKKVHHVDHQSCIGPEPDDEVRNWSSTLLTSLRDLFHNYGQDQKAVVELLHQNMRKRLAKYHHNGRSEFKRSFLCAADVKRAIQHLSASVASSRSTSTLPTSAPLASLPPGSALTCPTPSAFTSSTTIPLTCASTIPAPSTSIPIASCTSASTPPALLRQTPIPQRYISPAVAYPRSADDSDGGLSDVEMEDYSGDGLPSEPKKKLECITDAFSTSERITSYSEPPRPLIVESRDSRNLLCQRNARSVQPSAELAINSVDQVPIPKHTENQAAQTRVISSVEVPHLVTEVGDLLPIATCKEKQPTLTTNSQTAASPPGLAAALGGLLVPEEEHQSTQRGINPIAQSPDPVLEDQHTVRSQDTPFIKSEGLAKLGTILRPSKESVNDQAIRRQILEVQLARATEDRFKAREERLAKELALDDLMKRHLHPPAELSSAGTHDRPILLD